MDKRFFSRKFQLAVAGILAGIVFFSLKWMTADQWISYMQWIVGLYMAGNVGDTFAEKVKQ